MRKCISVMLIVIIVLGGAIVPTSAADNGDLFTYRLNEDGASYTVTGIKDMYVNTISVPSEYKGLPVTSISAGAFLGCHTTVTVVIIPEGIKEIGNSAFAHFGHLRSISLPLSLEKIGWCAFYESTENLKYIYYPGTAEQWENISVDHCGLFGNGEIPEGVVFSSAPKCHVKENILMSTASKFNSGLVINQCMVCGKVFNETYTPQYAPDKPTIKAFNGKNGVHITFLTVEGADRYYLYRRTEGSSWKRFNTVTDFSALPDAEPVSREVFDRDAKSGTTYYYTIKAENEGGFSTYDKTGFKIKYVKAPKLTKIANESTGVKINWNKVSGADGYYIYRADADSNTALTWTKIATVKKQSVQSYLDSTAKSGKRYAYMVKAYDGKEVSWGNTLEILYLATPKIASVKNEKDGVHINWGLVSGADKYIVYRKTSNTSWTRLSRTSASSYVDATAKNGTTYYYTVKAQTDYYDENYQTITNYSAYNKTGLQIKYITAPKLNKITNEADGIKISWEKVSGADGYYVYRRKTGTSAWTKIATIKKNTTVSYKDKTVASGERYDYTVKAFDGKATSGCNSLLRSYRLTVPALKSVKKQGTGVSVNWAQVQNADGYYVYRKTANTSWVLVGTVNGTKNLKFTDNPEKGNTYVYTVRAFKGSDRSYYNTKGISVKL